MVKVYVNQLCAEIGCTPENIYSKETNSWSFMRCFSPVCPLPVSSDKKMLLYQEALQNNTSFMGVKLAIIPDKGYMYAVAEKDIEGMDYDEFKLMISDLGYWADQLDDIFIERFGSSVAMN